MSVTLSQIRTMDNHYRSSGSGSGSGGSSITPTQTTSTTTESQILREISTMRTNGIRLKIIKKNVGANKFAINALQAQFLPILYRPPPDTLCELLNIKNES